MKIRTALLFLAAGLAAAALSAGEDCKKGQEVCTSPAKTTLGFLTALETAQKTAAPTEKGRPPAAQPPSPAPAPAAAGPDPKKQAGGFSKPGWLLAAGAGIAALYYYLKDGGRKRKRK